jgi:glycerophosphoryl diester phosphodiesterase
LENTIASIRAAFVAGADVVEVDVHPTTDGHFAVFHDWRLECRTNGTGETRAHTLAELKALDIGYGYTADGGKTYPFRGQGVGLMPSLDEVLAAFPEQHLLIDIKSNDPREGEQLADALQSLAPSRRQFISVYGGGEYPLSHLHARLPDLHVLVPSAMKSCVVQYAAVGWSGYVPQTCHHTMIMMPVNIGPWLWGWPNTFVDRMRAVGTDVVALGPYHGGASVGLDTAEDLKKLPPSYRGGIWTEDIETVAPLVRRASP